MEDADGAGAGAGTAGVLVVAEVQADEMAAVAMKS
jgi:hypothetical protein